MYAPIRHNAVVTSIAGWVHQTQPLNELRRSSKVILKDSAMRHTFSECLITAIQQNQKASMSSHGSVDVMLHASKEWEDTWTSCSRVAHPAEERTKVRMTTQEEL